MPTYDYICTKCSHAWELEQRIVEDPVRKCPKCGANTAKRQISAGAGFILKGGGWYADGYGSKKTSSSDSKPDDKPSGGESKTEKKTEPAATPEKKETKTEPKASAGETKTESKTDGKVSAA
jgi:putative FmdB family regulatory protein